MMRTLKSSAGRPSRFTGIASELYFCAILVCVGQPAGPRDLIESWSYRVTGLPVQSLVPMRRFHPKPYPGQSGRRRVRALRLWERLGDSVPVHRDRRIDRTYARSPKAAAVSRASTLDI